jgi:hypothetical protein
MFDTNCTWEIDWQKLDLSDGFWQMVIESGEEYNFAFQTRKERRPRYHLRHPILPTDGMEEQPGIFLHRNADNQGTHEMDACINDPHWNKRTSQTQKTLHPKSIPEPSTSMENPQGHLGIVLHLCG